PWLWDGDEVRSRALAQILALQRRRTSWAVRAEFRVVFYPGRRTQSGFQEKSIRRILIETRRQGPSPRLQHRSSCPHILYEGSLAETTCTHLNQIETNP